MGHDQPSAQEIQLPDRSARRARLTRCGGLTVRSGETVRISSLALLKVCWLDAVGNLQALTVADAQTRPRWCADGSHGSYAGGVHR